MNLLEHFLILFDTQVRGTGIKQVNKQIAGTTKGLMSANNMLKVFFGYDLYRFVKQLIPDLINTSQQLGAMESRFNAVSTSARAGAQELGWVGEQSKRLGLNFLKTADDYSIFYATVRKNMGQETTRKVFKDWAEAFRVLHIDPARQSRVLYALREMSSKGKIYMQDLALQLGSAVPDAMNLASKAMGYTGPKAVERFRQAIKDGEVDVQKFIPLFSKMVNSTYVNADKLAKAMNLPDAQIQLLTTHWQFLQKKIYEGGFGKDLVNTLKTLNRVLGFLEEHGDQLYSLLKGILGIVLLIGGLRAYSGIFKLIKAFPLFLTKISKFGLILRGIVALLGAPALRLVIAFFSGPAGWIVGITALLLFILHKFFPNVEKALLNVWDGFVLRFQAWWIMVKREFENSALGKWIAGKYASKDVEKMLREDSGMVKDSSDWANVIRLMMSDEGRVHSMPELPMMKNLRPVNINTTNTIAPSINNTFQITKDMDEEEIARIVTEKSSKNIVDEIKQAIPNSKINGRPVSYNSLLPLQSTRF